MSRPISQYAGGFRLDRRAETESDGVPSATAVTRTTARGGKPATAVAPPLSVAPSICLYA